MAQSEQVIIEPAEYVSVTSGEPFRLLPLGRLVKGGEVREITMELLKRFRLPHFKPPIKLGGHGDELPAGGQIGALEVRDDGLYAIPEYTEKGQKAIDEGDFRYQSPEIIWDDDGGFEDPSTGELINGPLIVGDALLHRPHLGGAAALYSVEPQSIGGDSMTDTVTVPVSWLDRLFKREPEPQQEPEPPELQVDNFEAKYEAEREQVEILQAQMAQMQADQERDEGIQHFAAELAETTLAEDAELHALLVDLPEETAAEIVKRFKALGEQVRVSNLEADQGKNPEPEQDADTAFMAAITAKMEAEGIEFNAALPLVIQENPELYKGWGGR